MSKWINKYDEYDETVYECSECKFPLVLIDGNPEENSFNYCPRCGARLIGEGIKNEISVQV